MAYGGVGPPGGQKKSWADILGSSLPTEWCKNVLEVTLVKDSKGPFQVSDDECANFMRKIGLNVQNGQVEAVQICPNGRGIIFLTLKRGEPLENYYIGDVIEVTSTGIRAIDVKPAGKKEIIVTLRGLHPNTKDEGVIAYLSKFGKVVTTRVIYCTYSEGPLKGLKNGDRSYKMELKVNENIGTYHVLHGTKITLRYR